MIIKYLKMKFFFITLERFPNIFRPSSKPFISGDTFRSFANHIFDETKSFDPKKVMENDIVFLSSSVIKTYFKIQHPFISKNYYLITHNSQTNINDYIEKYLDEKIKHWYSINLELGENDKVSLIPLGLENLRRLRYGRRKWFSIKTTKKSNFILCSFSDYSNYEERKNIKKIANSLKLVDVIDFQSTENYFQILSGYKFIICPPGRGFDTTRIWESLLLDVFPIFVKNKFTLNLKLLNTPGLYLDSWEDLTQISEETLNKEYKKLLNMEYKHLTSYDYWYKKIKLNLD